MDLGIITYIAEDKSHGYLFKLNGLEERHIYEVAKNSPKDDSLKVDLNHADLDLKKFQIVKYSQAGKSKKTGKAFARIESISFWAVAERNGDNFRIIMLDFEKEIYLLESNDVKFADIETGVVKIQLYATIERNKVDIKFDNVVSQFEGKGVVGFWLEKLRMLPTNYTETNAPLLDVVLVAAIEFLKSQFREQFDLNKQLAKIVRGISESCKDQEYSKLIRFISSWQSKYPDFFKYSVLSGAVEFSIHAKIELGMLGLFSFDEIFEDGPLSEYEIGYVVGREKTWRHGFLSKLKTTKGATGQIQAILLGSIPKVLPTDFTEVKAEIEFVEAKFPEYKADYGQRLTKGRTPVEQVQLWEHDLIESPSIETLGEAFPDVGDGLKKKILESIPLQAQISILSLARQRGLEASNYCDLFFMAAKTFIQEAGIAIIDLEYDGHRIKEVAYSDGKICEAATTESDIEPLLLKIEEDLPKRYSFLSGHNVEEFDLPLLEERIKVPKGLGIVDTLFIETLLSPTIASFALETKHRAKDDVEHTLNLLANQVVRLVHISDVQLAKFDFLVEKKFMKLIYRLRDGISQTGPELNVYLEQQRDKYFVHKDVGKLKRDELTNFLKENIEGQAFIVAPKVFFPLISQLPNVVFGGEDENYSKPIAKEKIEILPAKSLEKYLLESYLEKCDEQERVPIYANLPGRIKILIRENATKYFITEAPPPSLKTKKTICVTPDGVIDILPVIRKSKRAVVLLEADLIAVTEKTLLKKLDHSVFNKRFNDDSFWMFFAGGQSRVEIEMEDLKRLDIDVPDHFDNFWIEKTSFDTFEVWGNFDFRKLLTNTLTDARVLEFNFSKDGLRSGDCNYVVPRTNSANLSITRYNPETRYRDRYWTFQLKLVSDIILKTGKTTVLIINLQKEKQKLYDYFTHQKYFVPDSRASMVRQVSLLVAHFSTRKVLIITKEQIPELIQCVDLDNFNFILDSFELEEKWFISKGSGYLSKVGGSESSVKFRENGLGADTLHSGDEEDDEENANPISSSRDVFLSLKLQKPIIDYYRWIFNSVDKHSVVWLTDSRLGDFAGLEEEWQATRKVISIWRSDEEYQVDYKSVKVFFPSPKARKEIKLDIEATKEALRDIFLKDNGTTHKWFPYQHDYLNEILPALKDILVTLPTGGGKSVLFQAPALYRGSISGRLTVVVTPLKALMEDHVNKLWELNFWSSVECINSDRKDTQSIYRRVAGGEILLLYITPERFRSKSFINALKMRLENDGGLEYTVYDEAHCVSQWGLDFRPDYLNSTNVNIALKEGSDTKYPLLLFSATVSEQIYNDFQSRFDHSLNRLKNHLQAYNPLREHIAVKFQSSEDVDDKLTGIAKALHEANFDTGKSRCLVFVRRRKDAEENVSELEGKLNGIFGGQRYSGKVAYFHAGMNADERHEVYDAFKSGSTSILLATKAFGMGMDIPNVHYVYHLGPSGTLEDYLQEVGRAGRNESMLKGAGFSIDKPIQSTCFFEKDDFKRIKTLLQDGRTTWANLISVYSAVKSYYATFRDFETQRDKPIVLPFNILSKSSDFEGIRDKNQLLRLSLYWIEKLERIKLGFYAPGQLEFSAFSTPPENQIESDEQRKLIGEIERAWRERNILVSGISIELSRLLAATGLSSSSELLKLVFKCQKAKMLRYENDLIIYPTKKRMDELKYFAEGWQEPKYATVEAVCALSTELMKMTRVRDQYRFEGADLDEVKRATIAEVFIEGNFPWCKKFDANGQSVMDEKRIQGEQRDFERNKVKFSFTLAGTIPKVRHQSLMVHKIGQHSKVTQVIYNGCKRKEDWQEFIRVFKKDLTSLLNHISKRFIRDATKRYNVSELVLALGLEEKETDYIENLLAFGHWLGYLHYEGTFLPMGVELYMQSQQEIRKEENNSLDKRVHEEFEDTQKLRGLRLIALECLSSIQSTQTKDKFITDYFRCDSSAKIVSLLIEHLGEGHEALKGFRDEALKQAVYGEQTGDGVRNGGLSDEQLAVYESNANTNIQVIAGPGSGKTHTLILRVARLIHEENVRPENILVLAYNRAVVAELKERLTKLFNSLGYANLIQRLKVFTFHGFCKYSLRDSVRDLEFAEWIPKFLETARNQRGIIDSHLGVIRYVFVDEFQDITSERLELLKLIANPQSTFTTVIGDPNQSIYGYERVNEGGNRSPKENYNQFFQHYNPTILRIGDNFRSYPKILAAAEQLLSYNQDRFDFVPLRPTLHAVHDHYREIISCAGIDDAWLEKLGVLIKEKDPATGHEYRQIAVMFRSNVEIYRAYNLIEKKRQEQKWSIRIRIQGENEDFTRTREIAWVLESHYKPLSEQRIDPHFIGQYRTVKSDLRSRFPNWDFYFLNFFECLLLEYAKQKEDNALYNDLLEFIVELTRKDDGQLSKIYYSHIREVTSEDHKIEVVLTTMHKVKGLEFDAVLIPNSFTNLPMMTAELRTLDAAQYKELIEEERRLMYVAYTRAKFRLVAFYGERERALVEGTTYTFPDSVISKLGVSVRAGLDKFFIGWGANDSGNSVFSIIEEKLKFGSLLSLKFGKKYWFLHFDNARIGCLSLRISEELTRRSNGRTSIEGFRVSNILRWTLEDTRKYDSKNGSTFEGGWTEAAKQRGYIYLVEFSGYGSVN